MNDLSVRAVSELFGRYYGGVDSFSIRKVEKRELAFTLFGKQGMVRHTSFPDMEHLKEYVRNNTPLHFYYSSAYYDDPSATMENKRWAGADLIFDIDGDHIEGADRMGYGEMLSVVKGELKKLLVLLTDDLGVDKGNLEVVFSGSRGYHVHVYSVFEGLESQERREIVDYISGRCASSDIRPSGITRWGMRIEEMRTLLLNVLNSQDRKWKQTLEQLTGEQLGDAGKKEVRGGGYIERNARNLALKKFSSKIDEPVTIDVHRLIRTPGSLHGKSGLMVKVIPFERVDEFDPLRETIPEVFKDKTDVFVTKKIKMELGEDKTELQEGKWVLPTYAALYAVLKGSAEFLPKGE